MLYTNAVSLVAVHEQQQGVALFGERQAVLGLVATGLGN